MRNRPLEPSPTSNSRQVVSQPLPAQKARWVFPLVRLQPLEPPAVPTEPLPAPNTPPYSTLQVDIQSVQTRRLPDARASNTLNQPPPVYLLHAKPTSTKLQERATKYAHIPSVYRDKEIGAA
ncbi:MAG TPA: hypothetical protein VGT82_01300, partial [Ktedonobacteraceae bacterium]|nr:hypothetical protein [Ktedonobacteraceae bacterium]